MCTPNSMTLFLSLTHTLSDCISLPACFSCALQRMQLHLLTASDCGYDSDSDCDSESDSAFTSFAFHSHLQARLKV